MKKLELISERNKKDLNQTEMSKLLDLSVVQYGKKERGEVDFTTSEIKNIKKILNLSAERVDEIFLN